MGNVRLVAEALIHDGVLAPQRETATGIAVGGGRLSRGQFYTLLKNWLYIGVTAHNGRKHAALHQRIIDIETWDRVQAT